jgi:NAD(P)-dependent dehydrogenase (short-subunit alcohol dehydrogenase family)
MLDGKVVVLAGVGGIGDTLARRYVQEGARLVFGDIDGDHAVALGKEIDPEGTRAVGTYLDGADKSSVAALIDLARARFGRIDGFHANFALVADAYTEGLEFPLEVFDEMVRVNQRGYLICSQLAVPAMIETGGGAMLYTSSAAASERSTVRFSYGMCKAAIQSLMRNVAWTYGPKRIRANALAPGMIAHYKFSEAAAPFIAEQVDLTPTKHRSGCPDDLAAAGAFLLSDHAGYITGQTIAVDGGLTMRN